MKILSKDQQLSMPMVFVNLSLIAACSPSFQECLINPPPKKKSTAGVTALSTNTFFVHCFEIAIDFRRIRRMFCVGCNRKVSIDNFIRGEYFAKVLFTPSMLSSLRIYRYFPFLTFVSSGSTHHPLLRAHFHCQRCTKAPKERGRWKCTLTTL